MSGGRWGYQSERIREQADFAKIALDAIADCELIIDWAECYDTSRAEAEAAVYDRLLELFDSNFGGYS